MPIRAKNVLYVDADEDDIRLMERAFQAARRRGSLHAVRDGSEATSWLAGEGEFADRREYPLPDLVLMEAQLPGMSGVEVLSWIRQQPALSTLPVIILSGAYRDSDVEAAYRLGANAFLDKPLREGDLREIARFVCTWLDYCVPQPAPAARPVRRWQAAETPTFAPRSMTRFPVHEPEGSECWGT